MFQHLGMLTRQNDSFSETIGTATLRAESSWSFRVLPRRLTDLPYCVLRMLRIRLHVLYIHNTCRIMIIYGMAVYMYVQSAEG